MGRDACREAHLKNDKSRSSARRRKGVLPARFFILFSWGLQLSWCLAAEADTPRGRPADLEPRATGL
jgi:hypothetical protein